MFWIWFLFLSGGKQLFFRRENQILFVDSRNESAAPTGYTPDAYTAPSFATPSVGAPNFEEMKAEDDLPF